MYTHTLANTVDQKHNTTTQKIEIFITKMSKTRKKPKINNQ